MQKHNFLLVANGIQASIYRYEDEGKTLGHEYSVSSYEVKQQDKDLITDRSGVKSGGGNSIPDVSSLSNEASPTDNAKLAFVTDVANKIDTIRKDDQMLALDIMASPEILGLLREKLDKNLIKLVDKEISKDGTDKSKDELLALMHE